MPHYLTDHYGDLASVAGLAISIGGFLVTIVIGWTTQRAVREGLARITSQVAMNEVGAVLQVLRVLDSACRDRLWASAMERCDEARTHLSRLSESPRLTITEQARLKEAPNHLRSLMTAVQRLRRSTPRDLASTHLNRLHEIITALSTTLGRLQNQALEHRDGH